MNTVDDSIANTPAELPAYLAGLNEAQRDAATYGIHTEQRGGPLLVIAGAGTARPTRSLTVSHICWPKAPTPTACCCSPSRAARPTR